MRWVADAARGYTRGAYGTTKPCPEGQSGLRGAF